MTNKISGKAVIQDYLEDGDITEEVRESMFIRWIADYDSLVGMVEDLHPQITHLYVSDYKAELPDGVVKIQQIAAKNRVDTTCTRAEGVSSWVTNSMYPDCELTTTIECKRCGPQVDSCQCEVPIYEVEIDRQWEMSNPQYYLKGWNNTGTIGKGEGLVSSKRNDWRLLRPALDDFHRHKYFLNDCLNFQPGMVYSNSFKIDPPFVNVDFPEGELIISYLGKKLDEEGDIMVPEDGHYLEGLIAHLDFKWWARESKRHAYSGKTNARLFKQYSVSAKEERKLSISRYKSRTVVPDYKEWNSFMKKHFLQRIPNRNFDEGMKRGLNTEIFSTYSNLLTSGDRQNRYLNG
jgi:hypothetical protein